MTSYLQRLFDRAAGLAARPATALTPSFSSRSPIAEADQRLNLPDLAASLFAPSPGFDAPSPGDDEALTGIGEPSARPMPRRAAHCGFDRSSAAVAGRSSEVAAAAPSAARAAASHASARSKRGAQYRPATCCGAARAGRIAVGRRAGVAAGRVGTDPASAARRPPATVGTGCGT